MKTIRELRELDLNIGEVASSVKYLNTLNFDFNVFLPTKGKNLQREFVWTLHQKREIIWSLLYNRRIPHMAIICRHLDNKEVYEVIDGKQRLSSMIDFLNDKYTLEIDGKEYLYSELTDDYKLAIKSFHIRYFIVNEEIGETISDNLKIEWFKRINYSGTPVDEAHIQSLTQ